MTGCIVGHRAHSYECPGCAEANGRPQDLEAWRWYRGRTSSKRIRAAVTAVIAERTKSLNVETPTSERARRQEKRTEINATAL